MTRRLGALALGLSLAAAAELLAQAPERPVFRVAVESVFVDAFVTRRGEPVVGLGAPDFELKDNGMRQDVGLVAAEKLPLLAILALDTSNSVAGAKLDALRAAGNAFLDGLRSQEEVALLGFSQEIAWLAGPTRDGAVVRRALASLGTHGATAALDALYAALTLRAAQPRVLVVLFSDGEDNLSWLDSAQVQAVAERSNALVHVVGLHGAEDPEDQTPAAWRTTPAAEPEHLRALREIAEVTGGRLWTAESPERLTRAFAAVAEAMNRRYVLRYEPRGVRREGWHRIEVRLKGHKGDVHARRGYRVGAR